MMTLKEDGFERGEQKCFSNNDFLNIWFDGGVIRLWIEQEGVLEGLRKTCQILFAFIGDPIQFLDGHAKRDDQAEDGLNKFFVKPA